MTGTRTVDLPELTVIELDHNRDFVRMVRDNVEGAAGGREHKLPAAMVMGNGIITESQTVSNTTDETTVYTEPIPADTMHAGQAIITTFVGRYSTTNATDTFTARLKVGGTTINSIVSTAANQTDAAIKIEFIYTVRSTGASGSVIAATFAFFADEVKSDADTSTTAVDFTQAEDITLTIAWSAGDPDNSFTLDQAWTQFIA